MLQDLCRAPLLDPEDPLDGMIDDPAWDHIQGYPRRVPGKVLDLFLKLRKAVGVLEAKKKDGVKFKVRSTDDLVDKIRDKANELGLLIYPSVVQGKGHVVEDGTLAEVQLQIVLQAVEDGSRVAIAGFGLGADNQDKAGGKAGTYAFKSALVQAMLAQGKDERRPKLPDTDDTDSPIPGGVKPKEAKLPKATVDEALMWLKAATPATWESCKAILRRLSPEDALKVKYEAQEASARVQMAGK